MKFINKKNFIYIKLFIIILLISIILYFLHKEYIKKKSYETFNSVVDDRFANLIYYDENNSIIDSENLEKDEQDIAKQYIDPDNVVLELGARYGTVSCVINKILNNKKNQVVIEPDDKVWAALENNKNINNCDFHIIKGFVSNKKFELSNSGYGSSATESEDSQIKSYKLEDIESEHNLKFDTLVVDCEGCLETFFDEYPHMYEQLKNITFEEDYSHKCNYDKIKEKLVEHGFVKVYEKFNEVLRSMWKKN
jgi:FkbM family methyltransferase